MTRAPLQASVDLQQELHKLSTPQHLVKSSLIFMQGDLAKGAYLVESGRVGLMLKVSRHGRTVCGRILGKGSLLGLPAAVNNAAYSLTAKALCDVDLAFISREKLVEEMNQNLLVATEIVKILSQEVHDMRGIIRTKARTRPRTRKISSPSRQSKRTR